MSHQSDATAAPSPSIYFQCAFNVHTMTNKAFFHHCSMIIEVTRCDLCFITEFNSINNAFSKRENQLFLEMKFFFMNSLSI